ncbi:hypothetical protein BOTBODRAFT_56770 [Botryobasidium botryosum FD-172 SS1]|uniref:Uncharacterized protein n=1 Tax=Botryobasidium botryosum (strain FD-172 SS1) TaxID=930990 RepID=A0A067MLP7_BOTB1|nr:hypothetical protein BOTBODRAFT_56770 [Botryobasidium botryosum FD-172 SS1]
MNETKDAPPETRTTSWIIRQFYRTKDAVPGTDPAQESKRPSMKIGKKETFEQGDAEEQVEDFKLELALLRAQLQQLESQSASREGDWLQIQASWEKKREVYHNRLTEAGRLLADSRSKEEHAAARKRELSEQITKLTAELRDAHDQHASLRNHLQLQDPREPKAIVDDFIALKRSIAKACFKLASTTGGYIIHRYPNITSSDQAVHMLALKGLLKSHAPLACSPQGVGRPLHDFIDTALCVGLNGMLFRQVLSRFHWNLEAREDQLIWQMYQTIRRNEPQAVSAKWRSSAFKAIDCAESDAGDEAWAQEFVAFFNDCCVIPLVKSLCGHWSSQAMPESLSHSIYEIALKARAWHREIRSNFMALDFTPVTFEVDAQLDPESMLLYKKHRPNAASCPRILATVGLGL